jgi:hypothetical protein
MPPFPRKHKPLIITSLPRRNRHMQRLVFFLFLRNTVYTNTDTYIYIITHPYKYTHVHIISISIFERLNRLDLTSWAKITLRLLQGCDNASTHTNVFFPSIEFVFCPNSNKNTNRRHWKSNCPSTIFKFLMSRL